MSAIAQCRLCGASLTRTFVDLGMSPLCESYVPADRLDGPETFYPLNVRLCESCLLVQLPAYVSGEHIFSDYAYFSSYSDSWVAHARQYADGMIESLGLTGDSLVTEVASNDGYLLQHFVAAGIPVLASSRPGTWRRPRGSRASAPRWSSWVPKRAPRSRRGTGRPTWSRATTSSPTYLTSAGSRPGCAPWSRTPGRSPWSSRTCSGSSSAASTTRSTTSTSPTCRC